MRVGVRLRVSGVNMGMRVGMRVGMRMRVRMWARMRGRVVRAEIEAKGREWRVAGLRCGQPGAGRGGETYVVWRGRVHGVDQMGGSGAGKRAGRS